MDGQARHAGVAIRTTTQYNNVDSGGRGSLVLSCVVDTAQIHYGQ